MINVAELIQDPDFAQAFCVDTRVLNTFENEGEYTDSPSQARNFVGVIQPASPEDKVQFLPEGERTEEGIVIYTLTPLALPTDTEVEDVLNYKCSKWRIVGSRPFGDNGYYKSFAVRAKV